MESPTVRREGLLPHLRKEHGVAQSVLDSLTLEELLRYHGDDHRYCQDYNLVPHKSEEE